MNNIGAKKLENITLEGGKPWGFRIVGGCDMSVPLHVQQVMSVKAKSSGLEKGDRIVEINGNKTASLTHNDAKNLMVNSGNTLNLVVERDMSQSTSSKKESVSNVSGEIDRGMFSVPSRLGSTSEPTKAPVEQNLAKTSEPTQPLKKVEIKPKLKLDDETPEEKLAYEKFKKEEETSKQIEKDKHIINETTGLSHSSDVKSPFLKNLMSGGIENKSNDPVVKVNAPTASYTPPPNIATNDTNVMPSSSKEDKHKKKTEELTKPMSTSEAKICIKCKEPIKDTSYISASDRYYHKQHFSCEHCGNTLVGKAYYEDKDKKICCQNCISKGGSTNCKKCEKPIHGSFLTVGKECYHDDCFKCLMCKKSLKNEQFILSDGQPCCEKCYEETNSTLCVKCKKPIKPGESFVEVENGNCHSSCFTCKICKAVLTSFKMRDGYAICPKH